MPELDRPYGRHRWDPLDDIEALVAKDVSPATNGGEDTHTQPAQTSLDANG